MDTLKWILLAVTAVAGYLLGSINTSIIVGYIKGVDIRKQGSGNAGMTNTLRTLGKKTAAWVLLGDVLKGVIACLIGLFLIGDIEGAGKVGLLTGGMTAVLGHNWPLYFGFKGGKGVLTSVSVLFMMDWRIALIALGAFVVIVALTRYVSLGSITAAALAAVLAALPAFGRTTVFFLFVFFMALLIIYRHIPNIKRLAAGTESKLGKKAAPSSGQQ